MSSDHGMGLLGALAGATGWLNSPPRKHGLVVIGVHTPEFGFEGDLANVRRAAAERTGRACVPRRPTSGIYARRPGSWSRTGRTSMGSIN
jgi:hypothetical protein